MAGGTATAPLHRLADKCKEKQMSLDNIDGVSTLSGFGPVYVADRRRVRAYRASNFDLASLHDHGGFWVTSEVIVALGADVSRKRAVKILRHVIKRIEYEIEKGQRQG
jgi:hypothetical protein